MRTWLWRWKEQRRKHRKYRAMMKRRKRVQL
ncbi:hypothetical protein BJ970_006194 [Saccharopolyspora phatthalungensis]|uniref:Uncharacterized protein n=1 Tax=Saccharopolyspora phatthalungensis TaxID=664693 RepID=A0A840QIV4_9PSEU|nr:hypothetical protein [Saccharopolyspora phatthalungensis]